MFDKKFSLIIALFLILFISITFLSLTNTRLPFLTQATNQELDITKTVVIISKLEAIANGNDYSTITVFTRNSGGASVQGKRVDITTSLGILNNRSILSDNYGKAEFRLTSTTAGTADLRITIDNQPVTTAYSVNFVTN